MRTKILEKLNEIEKEKGVEILFAVESGSRAWGFESPDSDYDIRFVYKHKLDWYLNLSEKTDTIEFMTEDDLDGSGWDLRKTLRLLNKSNTSFLGWLFSPIIYRVDEDFMEELKKLTEKSFNPIAGFHHYHSMCKNFEEILCTNELTIKGYFYAIRTALCANWIYKKETIPPVLFRELYPIIDVKFHSKLDELIELKSKLIEKEKVEIPLELIELAKKIFAENESVKDKLKSGKSNAEALNEFFLKQLL
ncbi:nucleotidyltransferase domain-containing protein [Moheibacter sediminis]|uniref:Nucleotidyltransferase n=1 Tax=Moheibacter sediminis TaxID=1434700 RepID=A0A1W2C7A5_9FLAO|nr:nucleotidyltransferase domain-containing protein [Moheibacter sediminis]SMC81147.1 hypothetical protein SAMN06296427_10926 [Moheibacter sediminis]